MKRTQTAPLLLSAGAVLAATASLFAAGPHSSAYSVSCSGNAGAACHDLHGGPGTILTNTAGNYNICVSCHSTGNSVAGTYPVDAFKPTGYSAGVNLGKGSSHAFSTGTLNVSAINAAAGAGIPTQTAMKTRLANIVTDVGGNVIGGNIVCSTCHNQHGEIATYADGGKQLVSTVGKTGTGTGTMTFTAAAGSVPQAYLVQVVVGGAVGTATYKISHNGADWFGWNGTGWVSSPAPPDTTNGRATAATAVTLDDGTNVAVTFTGATAGSFVAGDRHYFSIGAGALRLALDKGANGDALATKFCRDCHSAWVMDATAVHTPPTVVGQVYSHPVGLALNSGGRTYDRTIPLDGNGAVQGSHTSPATVDKDGNPSNDVKLASDGTVQCFSCHGVHHADSNTKTIDLP